MYSEGRHAITRLHVFTAMVFAGDSEVVFLLQNFRLPSYTRTAKFAQEASLLHQQAETRLLSEHILFEL